MKKSAARRAKWASSTASSRSARPGPSARRAKKPSSASARQPYCLIVGGGQGGVALGARLKRLGVPTIIVDKHERPGDQWRKRYKSLCLHDPVWYDHLPYLPFPDDWPVFAPKDKIGDWLEMYAKVMELNYWASTECTKREIRREEKDWTVVVDRAGKIDHAASQATRVWRPAWPACPRRRNFPAWRISPACSHHSSRHPGGEAFKGKKCVVIGSNNSAHDICADLWEHGADVTMVQRSSTHVSKSDSLMELGLGPLYSEKALAAGITTDKADLLFASVPYRIMHERQIPGRQRDHKGATPISTRGSRRPASCTIGATTARA